MKTFYHGHTYTANPIACSAALASLEIFETEETLTKMKKTISILQRTIEKFKDLPLVGDIRNIALVAAIEIVKDKKTKSTFGFEKKIGYQIYKEGLKRNLLLRPLGNIIYFFPPLCIKENQLLYVLDNCYDIIKTLAL